MNPLERLAEKIAGNESLDRAGEKVAGVFDKATSKLPSRARVLDALHGTWLGHPLHPVLTDIPIGSWTFAAIVDVAEMASGKHSSTPGKAIAVGMVAAVPTAITGVTDWRQSYGAAWRVGVVHAALNNAALGLFGLSLALRRDNLGLARVCSFGGLGIVAVSGYLGGYLISNLRMGVKHEAEPAGEPTFFSEASVDGDLQEDTPRRVEVDGTPLMVVRHAGQLYALADVCPHLGCSLSEGTISGDAIVCNCHGSTFALEDGRVLSGPSQVPVASYNPGLRGAEKSPGPLLDPGME